MFKIGSFSEEIYQNMEKQLLSNQLEQNNPYSDHRKLAKAVDYIRKAAEIFDDAGMSDQSQELEELLRKHLNTDEMIPPNPSETIDDEELLLGQPSLYNKPPRGMAPDDSTIRLKPISEELLDQDIIDELPTVRSPKIDHD